MKNWEKNKELINHILTQNYVNQQQNQVINNIGRQIQSFYSGIGGKS